MIAGEQKQTALHATCSKDGRVKITEALLKSDADMKIRMGTVLMQSNENSELFISYCTQVEYKDLHNLNARIRCLMI